MAYSEILAERVRDALSDMPHVTEKKMFGGIAFMVDQKICVSVGKDRIMLRVDPAIHDTLVARKGCTPMIMKDKEFRGYVRVAESEIKTKRNLESWIAHAREFNARARKSARKQRPKATSSR